MFSSIESQAILNHWPTRSSKELEFSPPCLSIISTECLHNVMIKKIAQTPQVGTTDGYQCHTTMGAGGGSCGTQLVCQVNWWGDLMPEKYWVLPLGPVNLNTKPCKERQIYISNSNGLQKGFKTLLIWLLSLPGGKCSYSFHEGPLKRFSSEASSFFMLLCITSSLLMFHSSSSLLHSEVENVHKSYSEPCVPKAAVRASLSPRCTFQ